MSKKVLGENLMNCRLALPLTREELSNLLLISVGTLVSLENGKRSTTFRIQNSVLDFYNLTFDEVGYHEYKVPINFRELIIKRFFEKKDFWVVLNKKPPIPYAIKYKLLVSDFLKEPKEIHEIKEYFEKIGWSWDGTAISTAISRHKNLGISINRIEGKGGTFNYRKLI